MVSFDEIVYQAIEKAYLEGIRDGLQQAIRAWNEGGAKFGDTWNPPVPLFLEVLLHNYQEVHNEQKSEQ